MQVRTPAPPGSSHRPSLRKRIAWLAGAGGAVLLLVLLFHAFPTADAMSEHSKDDGKANRLIEEKSPYLQQHAYNPVDWYPWGEEAFARARAEDKPIFLSIGYSTCHWCHVMERESFENDSIAALINKFFVPIKVDREERPDVDRIYMNSVQAMTGQGGWPLNVFLTPDLKPFFGGTYFPPTNLPGRRGMTELVPLIDNVWNTRRDEIEKSGDEIMAALANSSRPDTGSAERAQLMEGAYAYFARVYDAERGGFGDAPKFPSPSNINFLFRYWAGAPDEREQARDMALRQLNAMERGGIHDHLGGGFHRYSVDADWLVSHFEKMLYDQAQLAWAYIEAYQITGNETYAQTARGIFEYVERDLSSPKGGFYSAEDADSEGEEGKFYVWRPEETKKLLGDDARTFDYYYGVTEAGNFEHATSVLFRAHSVDETATEMGMGVEGVERALQKARRKMLDARSKRIRPHLDDKVLTSWNGLMISAFARGARALEDPTLAKRAEKAADFIWNTLYDENTGTLTRRWRDGEAAADGQLDDYAYYALGLTDLYAATFDPKWLQRAVAVTEAQVSRFWDEKDGGFYESPGLDPNIKVRMKDGFDGAEIAGNSIAALNLQTLGTLLDREEWLTKAKRTFDYFTTRLSRGPAAMPQMLVAMDLEQSTPRHIVIAGSPGSADTQSMVAEFSRRFLPHDELLFVDGGKWQKQLATMAPFTEMLVTKDKRATAYVCIDYACKLPTNDPKTFAAQLDERPEAAATENKR